MNVVFDPMVVLAIITLAISIVLVIITAGILREMARVERIISNRVKRAMRAGGM